MNPRQAPDAKALSCDKEVSLNGKSCSFGDLNDLPLSLARAMRALYSSDCYQVSCAGRIPDGQLPDAGDPLSPHQQGIGENRGQSPVREGSDFGAGRPRKQRADRPGADASPLRRTQARLRPDAAARQRSSPAPRPSTRPVPSRPGVRTPLLTLPAALWHLRPKTASAHPTDARPVSARPRPVSDPVHLPRPRRAQATPSAARRRQ